MKNTYAYYLAILLPLIPVILMAYVHHTIYAWVPLFLIYALIYRPLIDGMRLIQKGVIRKSEIWKLFVPIFYRSKWFKQLYFS